MFLVHLLYLFFDETLPSYDITYWLTSGFIF